MTVVICRGRDRGARLVVGSHAASPVCCSGSVSAKFAEHARCTVLVVHGDVPEKQASS